jgi:hypothetical protein
MKKSRFTEAQIVSYLVGTGSGSPPRESAAASSIGRVSGQFLACSSFAV